MARFAIFDPAATPQRVLALTGHSEDSEDYIGRTDVVREPDLQLLEGIVPLRYWKHVTGSIEEYTGG